MASSSVGLHAPCPCVAFPAQLRTPRSLLGDGDGEGGEGGGVLWVRTAGKPLAFSPPRLFGFVARKQGSTTDNVCHLFAELDPEQPAAAIVNFVSRVMLGSGQKR